MKWLLLLLLFSNSAFAIPTMYDRAIKKWSSAYVPDIDWKLVKAQFYQESRLDPDAVSPVGAGGIAQVMPRTWDELEGNLKITGSRFDANLSIQFGSYYMMKMMRGWNAKGRTHEDRIKLAQASYNAGLGNLYKAQKKADGAMDWLAIRGKLHEVTGHHHKETLTYVDRIWMYWVRLNLQ